MGLRRLLIGILRKRRKRLCSFCLACGAPCAAGSEEGEGLFLHAADDVFDQDVQPEEGGEQGGIGQDGDDRDEQSSEEGADALSAPEEDFAEVIPEGGFLIGSFLVKGDTDGAVIGGFFVVREFVVIIVDLAGDVQDLFLDLELFVKGRRLLGKSLKGRFLLEQGVALDKKILKKELEAATVGMEEKTVRQAMIEIGVIKSHSSWGGKREGAGRKAADEAADEQAALDEVANSPALLIAAIREPIATVYKAWRERDVFARIDMEDLALVTASLNELAAAATSALKARSK